MFDHAQAVAAASDAVEAYIALAFTHLRLARVSEARQSVLAALQRAAAASHSAGEPHIWRSMCGSLMPLLAQVPDVPSAASAPLLRACSGGGESSSLQDAPGDAPLPPAGPPSPRRSMVAGPWSTWLFLAVVSCTWRPPQGSRPRTAAGVCGGGFSDMAVIEKR